jgi:hypothetical protein
MKKAFKKDEMLISLFIVLFVEVGLYFVADFVYRLGFWSKFVSQVGFYTAAVFMPFLWVWIFFGVMYVVVRKCQKCGSKNIHPEIRKGIVCDDCHYVFRANIHDNTKIYILCLAIPCLFFGLSFALGNVLAGGRLDSGVVFFSILLSTWLPSVFAEILYAAKLTNSESEFAEEHENLSFILFIISLLVLPILTLIGYGVILKFLFTGTI